MTANDLNDFLAAPDHKGLNIRVEMCFEAEDHVCEAMVDLEEGVPLD
jgi:hypothetical protein